jgi:hypothetical protein
VAATREHAAEAAATAVTGFRGGTAQRNDRQSGQTQRDTSKIHSSISIYHAVNRQ